MKKAIASAGLIALGAAASQTALAQGTSLGAPPKPWSISGTLRGFYDDNINTTPNGPDKQSSIGYVVIPYAEVNLSEGPNLFSASFRYSIYYYEQRVDNKADQDFDFELAWTHHFNQRHYLVVQDSFVIGQEPEQLSPTAAVSTPIRANGNNLRNTANVELHSQFTKLFGTILAVNTTLYDYQENAGNTATPQFPTRSALLDRTETQVRLDTTWVLDPTTTGVIGYTFGAIRYSSDEPIESPVNPPPGPHVASWTRNNNSHYVYLGADHTFSPELSGSGRLGLQYLDYYNQPAGNTADNLSPYVNLSLSYAYGEGGTASAGFTFNHNQTDEAASANNPAAGVTQDQESATLFVSASQQLAFLSPRLTGNATAQYQASVFNGGPVNGEVDNFYLFGLNLSYQFTHLFSGEVGYNYDLLQSDISGRGYSRNRVYLGVTAAY